MAFVSHAGNFEDVLLWRAFRTAGAGFYIDIGAGDPDSGSVTRAFHDRGWRGINVEPSAERFARLAGGRLLDINLHLWVGAPTTLAEICRLHAPAEIGFLKITAGAATATVLAGADFTSFRPRVILIGAAPDHAEWEPGVLAAGYGFAWFDGLSRFYLAVEHDAALRPHFRVPVNATDDFIRPADGDAARQLIDAERRIGVERSWATTRIAAERLRAARAEADAQIAVVMRAEQAAAAHRANAHVRHLRQQAASLSRDIETLRASTSWRVTAPLRNTKLALESLRGRPAGPPAPAPLGDDFDPTPARPPIRAASRSERRAVHQFHSGSAVGDAVTNAMLLTQRWLRKAGYQSEIYVEHRDPRLADRLFMLDDLPEHDDYVLIVRHSMGYDACARVIALPAPKILIYHNITPAKFFTGSPVFRHYAELGRRQLAQLRPHMRAALADSDFNALELRRHGYESPCVCPFLFDIATLPRTIAPTQHPFTVLFVGRIVASKAQADLVDAFAAFHRAFAAPARLILVGRAELGDPHDAEIRRRVAAHQLNEAVLLTGPVSDAALDSWYAQADLYVSLSHHEGFGVPLVEAMARGVPVLAYPAAAVPYTLGDAGELLDDRSTEAVAAAILRLAGDPAAREAMAARGLARAEAFRLDRHFPTLIHALRAAGAMPSADPARRAAVARNLQVTVEGHILGTHSLATINRRMALALEAARPGRVRVTPFENGPIGDFALVPAECRPAISALAARPPPPSGPEIVIAQHYPIHLPERRGDAALAMVAWEESLLPSATVDAINRSFDAVLAASRSTAKALIDSGTATPVHAIGYPIDLSAFANLERHGPGEVFTFLHVSSCFPRKGVDILLAAYAKAFRRDDPVRLVIKGFPNAHNDVPDQLARLREADPNTPEIVLINEDLDESALLDLYRDAGAMVLPTRGEGFNLPAAEAMAAGIPLIVTAHGGHLDFLGAEDARLIDYRFAPSTSHLSSSGSIWVEPDTADLTAALREAVRDAREGGGKSAVRAAHARVVIHARLDGWVAKFTDFAADLLTSPPPAPARIAWVSTWDVACGIAAYSRSLLAPIAELDVTVLCDDRTPAPPPGEPNRVRRAWTLGDPASADRLARAIAAEDAEIVVIQHQDGLLPWRDLAQLLTDHRLRDRTVVVTLHAAVRLLDAAPSDQSTIIEALGSAARILVHRVSDLDLLKSLGLTTNVTLFPHGCPLPRNPPAPRPLNPDAAPIIGSFGFFLPGKGLPWLIEAVARLRPTWPTLRLRLVNAAYPLPLSETEIARCRALAHTLGIDDAIEFHTAFQEADAYQRLLGGCDLLVLPYEPSKESSSAALRGAMASGVPVAVTPVAIFEEAGAAVHRFAAADPGTIAHGIDALLRDQTARRALRTASAAWLADRAWPRLATRMAGMLAGLHASRAAESSGAEPRR